VALIVAVGSVGIAWNIAFKSHTYTHRYRLTLALEANGSLHTGSSVVEVNWLQQTRNLPIPVPPFASQFRGEATFVDLGDGRAVVALLGQATGDYLPTPPEWLAINAYGLAENGSSIPLIASQAGIRPLEGRNIPALVILADKAKPESASTATPAGPERELAPGVKLVGVTIEITADPVTNQISQQLPWLLMPGRPAVIAWRAWRAGIPTGPATEPETLFRRG
jgi:hypothetical protein